MIPPVQAVPESPGRAVGVRGVSGALHGRLRGLPGIARAGILFGFARAAEARLSVPFVRGND